MADVMLRRLYTQPSSPQCVPRAVERCCGSPGCGRFAPGGRFGALTPPNLRSVVLLLQLLLPMLLLPPPLLVVLHLLYIHH